MPCLPALLLAAQERLALACKFPAQRQVIVNGVVKSLLDLVDIAAFEAHVVAEPEDSTVKDAILDREANRRAVPLVFERKYFGVIGPDRAANGEHVFGCAPRIARILDEASRAHCTVALLEAVVSAHDAFGAAAGI